MDEFARLMSMEGVRPLNQPKEIHAVWLTSEALSPVEAS